MVAAKAATAANLSLQGFGGGAGIFQPVDPTKADYVVSTATQLASALSAAHSGQTVYVADNAVIDASDYSFVVPQGVTLASGRGQNGSLGALLYVNYNELNSDYFNGLIRAGGPNVRITGLQIQGPSPDVGSATEWDSRGIVDSYANLEVDNNEISAWSHAGIYLENDARTGAAGITGVRIHHNSIHNCERTGLGYGICLDADGEGNYGSLGEQSQGNCLMDPLIQYNSFDCNRHSIAATGVSTESYQVL